jgi:hypothetical protein
MELQSSGDTQLRVPTELTGPLPRKARLNESDDTRYLLVVVVVFFVGGLIWLGWTSYRDVTQFLQRATLRGDARDAVGEVTGIAFGRYSPKAVNYTFNVNGVSYSGEATESGTPSPASSLSKSDKIVIRYIPSNPKINHPESWEWSLETGWYYSAGELFFTALGGFAFSVLLRDRRLARHGKAVLGRVNSCTRKDRRFQVGYEFNTEDRMLIKGENDCRDEYGEGARIWVLYLPRKPRRNHIYPLTFYSIIE